MEDILKKCLSPPCCTFLTRSLFIPLFSLTKKAISNYEFELEISKATTYFRVLRNPDKVNHCTNKHSLYDGWVLYALSAECEYARRQYLMRGSFRRHRRPDIPYAAAWKGQGRRVTKFESILIIRLTILPSFKNIYNVHSQ